MKLARALDVDPNVLTGESPPPDLTPRQAPVERSPIRAMIEPKARLAYTLLKQRYGVNATDIINMEPLFFTLLAEGSLIWRREQLEAADEAMERAVSFGEGHLAFMKAAYHVENGLIGERQSIEALDLFGEKVSDDAHYWDYDSSTENPFAAYLRKLAGDLGNSDVVSVAHDPLGVGLAPEYPDYDVCGAARSIWRSCGSPAFMSSVRPSSSRNITGPSLAAVTSAVWLLTRQSPPSLRVQRMRSPTQSSMPSAW